MCRNKHEREIKVDNKIELTGLISNDGLVSDYDIWQLM